MKQAILRLRSSGDAAVECLRSGIRTLVICAIAAVFAAELSAQFQAELRFANRTPFPRRDWQTATVPFPQGVWTAGKTFAVENAPSEVVPFGAPWPDGSVRFGRLDVRLDLRPREERIVRVVERRQPMPPFRPGPMILANLASFDWKLVVGVPNVGLRHAGLRFHSVVHASNARWTVLYRDRIPDTDLVYDLWLTLYSDQDHVRYELRLTNADTTSPRWQTDFDFVVLVTRGCIPNVRAGVRTNVRTLSRSLNGHNLVQLVGPGWLYDGQAFDWWGELLFLNPNGRIPGAGLRMISQFAAVGFPPYGVALNWAASGAFGPFGYLPPPPAWLRHDNGRSAALARRARFLSHISARSDPWEDREMGLLKDPSWTGDQYDFGAAKLVDVFRSGMPDRIEEARYSAGEEALRPVHFREPDGSTLKRVNHPSWIPWNGRSHYNRNVCPDRLGKPWPEPSSVTSQAHGWAGRDRQHWSSLTLASAYLLTCSDSLRMELDNEAEIYMAGHTLPGLRPNWSTNGIGAPRGTGRTSLSMAWNYLCTGRNDLKDWLVERLRQCNLVQTFGLGVAGPVKPMGLHGPDPRVIDQDHWRPWEDAQAVLGLEAAVQVTGFVQAAPLVYMGAKTLMTYGWKLDQQQRALVATGLAWLNGGVPLTPAQRNDPTYALWSYGTAFSQWSLPAVKIALRYGVAVGDLELVQLSWFVLQDLASRRSPPRHGGWDRYAEWDAVR